MLHRNTQLGLDNHRKGWHNTYMSNQRNRQTRYRSPERAEADPPVEDEDVLPQWADDDLYMYNQDEADDYRDEGW